MGSPLPFAVREAVVEVCGKAFWLKDPLKALMVSAGLRPSIFDQYAGESKFRIARNVLSELDAMGEEGWLVQRRIVSILYKLRGIPDATVADRDVAIAALRNFKELARDYQSEFVEEKQAGQRRLRDVEEFQTRKAAREKTIVELKARYAAMAADDSDPHRRGYDLQILLEDLFRACGISYRSSYSIVTEQIDGAFEFKNGHYLIEARWRKLPPSKQELGAFKLKVDCKFDGTRGLFLSVTPFRDEVVNDFTRGVSSNVILWDGGDLAIVLEQIMSLEEALDTKIRKAAQEGKIFYPLWQGIGGD